MSEAPAARPGRCGKREVDRLPTFDPFVMVQRGSTGRSGVCDAVRAKSRSAPRTTIWPAGLRIGFHLLLVAATLTIADAATGSPVQRPVNATLSIVIDDGYPVVEVVNAGMISVDNFAGMFSLLRV